MKRNKTFYIALFLLVTISFVACKKERAPRLIVHVQEKNGFPAIGAEVHAWPGNDPQAGGSGIVNEEQMDQTLLTDIAGNATFIFPFSAVLDVDVKYFKQVSDTLPPDTLTGSRVVKIELVRQRGEKNDFNETVEVQ
jgi:hypothetical protein